MIEILNFAFFVLTTSASPAVNPGPISHAMGNTGRATILATESIHLNPAFVSLARGYHLGMGYYNDEVGGQSSNTMNLAITDATSGTAFPAALSVSQNREQVADIHTESMHYALAVGNFYKNWAWGAAYRYNGFDRRESGRNRNYKTSQIDIGTLFRISKSIAMAVVGNGLLDGPRDLPVELRQPRELAVASTYSFGRQFRFQIDASRYFDSADLKISDVTGQGSAYQYGVGLDTRILKYLSFRLGWNRDDFLSRTLMTTGAAFIGPRLGVNYAFSQGISGPEGQSHRIDLSLPF